MIAVSDSAMDHWRSILAATAPAVAVATVLQGILGASAGVVIANGSFVSRPGWQDAVSGILWLLAWTLSLGAAMIVIRGALVDAPVRGAHALRMAVRRWVELLGTIVLVAFLMAMILLPAVVLQRVLGPLVLLLVVFAAVLAIVTVSALARAVLARDNPFTAVSRSWELATGKRLDAFGRGLVVMLPGGVITWAQPRIGSWASGPTAAFLLSLGLGVLSVIVIGFQASVLARWFVRLDGARRGLGSRPRPDRWRLGGVLLLAAAVAVSVVTTLNPWGVPVLASSGVAAQDPAMVVARGGAILPDGRRLTVFHDGGGPEVHFEICGGEPYCDTKLLTTFEKPGLMWDYRAAVAVGDGLAVVALVQQSGDPADEAKLVVWHCPTVACERTTRTVVTPVSLSRRFGGMAVIDSHLLFAADVDAEGHPQIAWGTPDEVGAAWLVRCGDPACTRSSQDTVHYATEVDGQWPALAGIGFDAQHRLVAALARYEERVQRSGLQIHIAEPPAAAPVFATVTCLSADCQDRSVRRWHVPEQAYHEVLRPVAGPGGTLVLVAREWYWTTGSGYLIRCENHCG